MSRLFKFCSGLCLAVAAASAQRSSDDTSFARPVLGYIFDSGGQQIRPLAGTPGAAVVSAGVSVDFKPDHALVSSAGAFAIVSVPSSDTLQIVRRLDRNPDVSTIPGALKAFDTGALSHSGKSAIVYAVDCHCIQILADLFESPRVEKTLTLAEGASVESLGVTDDASVFAVGQTFGEETQISGRLSLYFAGEDEPRTVLPIFASALAFSPNGQSLAITDVPRRSVSVVSDMRGAAELTEVASERDGLVKPIALTFAPGSRILVADADAGIQVIDTSAKRITQVECSCRPSMVERAASADLFRITDVQSGSLWMLQAGEENARAFFVPVQRVEPQEASEGR